MQNGQASGVANAICDANMTHTFSMPTGIADMQMGGGVGRKAKAAAQTKQTLLDSEALVGSMLCPNATCRPTRLVFGLLPRC